MTISMSRLSYTDCYEAMDKALADTTGVRVKLTDRGAAIFLRMRMHTARTIDKKDNAVRFEETPDHPMYGRSVYDALMLTIREHGDDCYLYIKKVAIGGELEPLSEVKEPEPEPEPAPTITTEGRRI